MSDNTSALREAVKRILEDEATMAQLRRMSRRIHRRFARADRWERITARILRWRGGETDEH